jgi:hypothetical protein
MTKISRAAAMAALCFASCFAPVGECVAQGLKQLAEARKVFGEARAAREKGDAAGYLKLMREAQRLRPDQPGAMYRLAGAYALNGKHDEALKLLDRIEAQGLYFNASTDADFASMRDLPAFQKTLSRMKDNMKAREVSDVAFRIADRDFLPEGIAYDAKSKTFFVASVHQGKIVSRNEKGEVKAFGKGREDGLWSVLALKVDAERGVLWATTAAVEQTKALNPADLGRTALAKYDLKTGKLLKLFEPPRAKDARVFGDLAVTSTGKVYVSEAQQGGIWRVTTDKLEQFVKPGMFASPQGMAFPGRGSWMYVVDYSLGLMRVDVTSRKVERVKVPADVCLLGVDALIRHRDGMIVIQNGVNPQRVMKLKLDANGDVSGARVLESNHGTYAEPTLGVIVDDALYYVANSQWEKFAKGKAAGDVKEPVILKLALTGK